MKRPPSLPSVTVMASILGVRSAMAGTTTPRKLMRTSRLFPVGFGIGGLGLALSLLAMVSMPTHGKNAHRMVPVLIAGLCITASASIPLGVALERERV